MRRLLLLAASALASVSAIYAETEVKPDQRGGSMEDDMTELVSLVLSDMPEADEKVRFKTLTDDDFRIVADELGVEVAAIKAVVRIEAGPKLEGFWAPGVPVANYVQSLFNKYNGKTKGRKIKDAKVPTGLSGYALKEWTSLTNARKTNADAADMGTYWGMFQIGGFNYKLCGCQTVEEMVNKVCESEFSQLEMFAVFIRNSGMLEALRKKDWASFARKYNGPSYAKRGYHTRMAKEYAAFKNTDTGKKPDATSVEETKPDADGTAVDSAEKTTTVKTARTTKKSSSKTRKRRKKTRK